MTSERGPVGYVSVDRGSLILPFDDVVRESRELSIQRPPFFSRPVLRTFATYAMLTRERPNQPAIRLWNDTAHIGHQRRLENCVSTWLTPDRPSDREQQRYTCAGSLA